jgi:hypothetical protein
MAWIMMSFFYIDYDKVQGRSKLEQEHQQVNSELE